MPKRFLLVMSLMALQNSMGQTPIKLTYGKPQLLTTQTGYVQTITTDRFNNDCLLLGNRSALTRFNVETGELNIIAGSATETGYRNGEANISLFNHILGIAQLWSRTIIVSDAMNDCIRQISMDNITSPLLGLACGIIHPLGNMSAQRIVVPGTLLLHEGVMYFVDELDGGRIGEFNLTTKTAKTLTSIKEPVGLTLSELVNDTVLLTTSEQTIYMVYFKKDPIEVRPLNGEKASEWFIREFRVQSASESSSATGSRVKVILYGAFYDLVLNTPTDIASVPVGAIVSDSKNQRVLLLHIAGAMNNWYSIATNIKTRCIQLLKSSVIVGTSPPYRGLYRIPLSRPYDSDTDTLSGDVVVTIIRLCAIVVAVIIICGTLLYCCSSLLYESPKQKPEDPPLSQENKASLEHASNSPQPTVDATVDENVKQLFYSDHVYEMTRPRGRALIIHVDEYDTAANQDQVSLDDRVGSEIDRDKIQRLMDELGFLVKILDNPPRQEIMDALKDETKLPEHQDYGMFVLIILAHGTDRVIYGADARPISYEYIIDCLSGEEFKTMKGKPKWIIIQACSGKRRDIVTDQGKVLPDGHKCNSTTSIQAEELDVFPHLRSRKRRRKRKAERRKERSIAATDQPIADGPTPTIRTSVSDILTLQSSFPGYVALRSEDEGSYFIEALDHVLREHACHDDLHELTRKVGRYVIEKSKSDRRNKEGAQTPTTQHTLLKRLYLFPHYNPEKPETPSASAT